MSHLTLIFLVFSVGWMSFLQLMVVFRRISQQIALGHGDDKLLERRIRAHANAMETLLPFSVLLIGADLAGIGWAWLSVPALLMLVGRLLHPWGILNPRQYISLRINGMRLSVLGTLMLVIGVALWALFGMISGD